MNTGFVYVRSHLSSDEVKELLQKLEKSATEKSYYFVRSPHAVSGICMKLPPEFPGFEGQMFNADRELRWKKQGSQYELLLLSRIEADLQLGFDAIDRDCQWEICDRPACFHAIDETKFPKSFIYQGENGKEIDSKNISIGQRYFQDPKTATVHFVALTIRS
jgi:hypothetical protein